MKLDTYFKQVLDIQRTPDFKTLQQEILNFNWDNDIYLTKNAIVDPTAFKNCYVLQMLGSPLMEKIRPRFNVPYHDSTKKLISIAEQTINPLLDLYPSHYMLKAHIVALKPGGVQVQHIDNIFYHHYTLRLILPIITNLHCRTRMEDTTFHLEEGRFHEMNNSVMHGSENLGTTIRTHLFVDLIPKENLSIIKDHYKIMTLD